MSRSIIFCLLILSSVLLKAQPVTGVWKGRINNTKVEVKIIQEGDSLKGTAYYINGPGNYRRYSIKGYFDQNDNSVVWWDDQFISGKGGAGTPLLSVADFNCPNGGEMHLDGKASTKDEQPKGIVKLTKTGGPSFPDEWDFVIDNYTIGANDPYIIDSVALIALAPAPKPQPTVPAKPVVAATPKPEPVREPAPQPIPAKPAPVAAPEPVIAKLPPTIEEKFTSRSKIFTKEIPLQGDSIELRFYDNAEVDGDSISLFLNGKMMFSHVRLTDKAYSIKLAISALDPSNELVMVAENLGSIPPNTSYMLAIMGDKRYEAYLASTENSSAMIRLRKE